MRQILVPKNMGGAAMPYAYIPDRPYHIVQYITREQTIGALVALYQNSTVANLDVMKFVDILLPYGISVFNLKRISDEVVKRVWASQNIKKKDHYVQSSTGHLTYTVRYRDEDGWSCTCPSFTYHQGYCKHIRQVLANPQEFMSN